MSRRGSISYHHDAMIPLMNENGQPAIWLMRRGRFCGSYRPAFPHAVAMLVSLAAGL